MAIGRFIIGFSKFTKRGRFVFSTAFLTIGLLVIYLIGPEYANQSVSVLAVLSGVLTLFSLWEDLPRRKQSVIVILPAMLFTIAMGLFYFVLPGRWATRIIMLTLFIFGFYATLLVQNIYTISVIRNIKLLAAARTIGFLLAVATAFCLYYILYSLHTHMIIVAGGVAIISFLLAISVLWSVSLKEFVGRAELSHSLDLTLCITEIGVLITFWPVSIVFAAIFLTGNFYTLVGLSQHWLEHRLFKRVLWEFIWVAVILVVILFFTTKWGG